MTGLVQPELKTSNAAKNRGYIKLRHLHPTPCHRIVLPGQTIACPSKKLESCKRYAQRRLQLGPVASEASRTRTVRIIISQS